MDSSSIQQFIDRQLAQWQSTAERTHQLGQVLSRTVAIAPRSVTLQYNPARRVSTAAKTDAASIEARPCFLCAHNRPAEQTSLAWHEYQILVNPFPIFPNHLTIAHIDHVPQRIGGRIQHLGLLAHELDGFTVFYNGPACGASAPDHMHFQAAPTIHFPIWNALNDNPPTYSQAGIAVHGICPAVYSIQSESPEEMERDINKLIGILPTDDSTGEPKLNILVRRHGDTLHTVVIPRRVHRPSNFAHDPEAIGSVMISPASVDMGGVIITVRQEDFDNLSPKQIAELYTEVGYDTATLINYLEP